MNEIQFKTGLSVGGDAPVRINCNIGCNSLSGYDLEKEKLLCLREEGVLPDMMMDLSLIQLEKPLYQTIRDELSLPFGSVLAYHCFDKKNGLCWENTKSVLLRLCQEGISFITVHFTADADLFQHAIKERKIPITSRGGGIVLYDTKLNHRSENVFREHINEIVEIVLKYDVVVSLGSTFRPSTIFDACDATHIEETMRQLEVCRFLQKNPSCNNTFNEKGNVNNMTSCPQWQQMSNHNVSDIGDSMLFIDHDVQSKYPLSIREIH